MGIFFLPKQSPKSRSVLKEGSRYLGLFKKGETLIIAKFQRTYLVICSHSREGETLSHSRINTIRGYIHLELSVFEITRVDCISILLFFFL